MSDLKTDEFQCQENGSMVHVPLFVPEDRYDPDPKKAYRLAMEHVDWTVGRVMETLEELNLAENTLIVYTSDNGPWLSKDHHGGSALPLRDIHWCRLLSLTGMRRSRADCSLKRDQPEESWSSTLLVLTLG